MVRQKSSFWKFYTIFSIFIVIGTLLELKIISNAFEKQREAHHRILLKEKALAIDGLIAYEIDNHEQVLKQELETLIAKYPSWRISIFIEKGNQWFDSQGEENTKDIQHAPEVLNALSHGESYSIYNKNNNDYFYYAKKSTSPTGQSTFLVRLGLPWKMLNDISPVAKDSLWLLLLITGTVIVFGGLLLRRKYFLPLSQITQSARGLIQKKEYEALPAQNMGYCGELARALNRIAKRIESRVNSISNTRDQLETILASMVDGVIAVDEQMYIVHINNAAEEMLDINAKKNMGKPIWEVIRIRELNEILDKTMSKKRAQMTKVELLQPQQMIIEVHCAPLKDELKQVKGAVIVLDDQTEFEKLAAARRDFVTNASHDLKTPITAIRCLVETIVDDEQMPVEARKKFLNRVYDQSLRLNQIINHLLSLASAEYPNRQVNKEVFDINSLIDLITVNFRAIAEQKKINLQISESKESLKVKADKETILQAINNLIDNAIKYTSEGGTVKVSFTVDKATVKVTVKDNGPGIEEHELKRVFERFYRVDKSRTRSTEEASGNGLGLAIVKHIAHANDGTVTVSSEVGKGSEFCFVLPLYERS